MNREASRDLLRDRKRARSMQTGVAQTGVVSNYMASLLNRALIVKNWGPLC